LGGISATGLPWFRTYFEPLLPGFLFAPPAYDGIEVAGEPPAALRDPLADMERMIEWENANSVAAIIMDPLPGSNTGFPVPPKGYLESVRALCDKYDILLIFDEVQTGFGKTGKWFACEHWNVVPDIITLGKGFSAGYVPLGAAVTTPRVADCFTHKPGQELRTGSTYGGHSIACAAALATIGVIEKEHLVDRAAELGEYLKEGLNKLRKYPIVGDVRGLGLLLAVELMQDAKTKKKFDPALGVGRWIGNWCFEHGMIMRNNGEILVAAPALTITKEEVDTVLNLLDQSLAAAIEHFGL
jgi:taurine--2-oxoglutarate transaminase